MNQLNAWIFGLPWWGSLLVLCASLLLLAELGFRLARANAERLTAGKNATAASQVSVVLGAMLALLGLLLAFSFGIVQQRFDARKALVLQEANAIGTAYLRAGLLPAESREKIRTLLREYVDIRLSELTPTSLDQAIERSGQIHDELWHEAEAVGTSHPESVVVGKFISALNELIDLHASRVSIALHQRLPSAIFNVLFSVAILCMLVLGYGAGLAGWRASFPVAALILSVAAVLVMIQQLDAPGASLFRISQWAMQDVQRTIQP